MLTPKKMTGAGIVSEPYPATWIANLMLLFCVVGVAGCIYAKVRWYWCVPGVLFLLFLGGTVMKQAVIDCTAHVVVEYSRLFGRRLLKTEQFPFSDFDAVCYEYCADGDEIIVGIRHRSGRTFWFRRFGGSCGRPGRGAAEFAWRLSGDTGLKIDDRIA